jgi:transglutaminase-like putative cysteine protease
MNRRVPALGLLLAAAVGGAAFAPTFGMTALVAPVLAAVLAVGGADELARRQPRLAGMRPVLALVGGAVLVAVTVPLPALPGSSTVSAVARGAVQGWIRTLESTFPAKPVPELITFVPLLVLLAAVLGVEWLRRGVPPLATLLPGLAVLGLAQAYAPASGWSAVGLAAGFGGAAVLVLAEGWGSAGRATGAARRLRGVVALALPSVLLAGVGAAALAVADPVGQSPWSLHDQYELPTLPAVASNPLGEIGGRLESGRKDLFTVRTDADVDRWPVAALDTFDGANWTTDAQMRPLGAALAQQPRVTTPTVTATADFTLSGWAGPWLPTQFRTRSVDGVNPSVDPVSTMLVVGSPPAGLHYTVTWLAPQIDAARLAAATLDRALPGATRIDEIPQGILDTAKEAIGSDPPSFRTALRLEQWMRTHYTVASGADIPTGNSFAQLLYFLGSSKRGTSEQFAASYVVLARAAGMPARLVVGFKEPAGDAGGTRTVHNSDVFAWPEVAVTGVGWVPLDPTGGARSSGAGGGLAAATDAARKDVPQPGTPAAGASAPAAPAAPSTVAAPSTGWSPVLLGAAAVAAVAALWLVGVPGAKALRRRRRRRSGGADAVRGAWQETRDRLREHGVAVTPGQTVRELVEPAQLTTGVAADHDLQRLAACVDNALWSGGHVPEETVREAWDAEGRVRRALSGRGLGARLRAATNARALVGR